MQIKRKKLCWESVFCSPSPGEPPLGVVSGENVTLPSSVIVLRREAIPTMLTVYLDACSLSLSLSLSLFKMSL